MAKKKAELILIIKTKGGKALKALPKLLSGVRKGVQAAAAGLAAYGASVVAFANQASKFREVQRSFRALAEAQGKDSEEMLQNMRDLSQGTVSDMKLMQAANQALLLGLPVDRFGDMLKIARASSKATGESMEFMLNSIVTGLGRGSKLILDNLGIVFNLEDAYDEYAKTLGKTAAQLTDAEKKQAFINKAMEIGSKNAEAMGDASLSLTDRLARVQARVSNAAVELGDKLGPAFEFVLEKMDQFLDGFERFIRSEFAIDIIKGLTKGLAILRTAFIDIGDTIGTVFGGAADAIGGLLEGNFKRVRNAVATASSAINEDIKKNHENLANDLNDIDDKFQAQQMERREAEKEAIQLDNEEKLAIQEEQNLLEMEQQAFKNLQQQEAEAVHLEALNQLREDAAFIELEQEIAKEKNKTKALALATKRRQLIDQQSMIVRRQQLTALERLEQEFEGQRLQAKEKTLGRLAGMQSSNNKTLAAIGKAAAKVQIIIDTARGAISAYASLAPIPFVGPILGAAAAAAIIAFGAEQLVRVNTAPALQEGGIVQARPGGTLVRAGEGGQDEAVIPLEEERLAGLAPHINITVNGGMLGDEASAREFAIEVDKQLLELRRSNESQSFDEAVV